MKKIIKKQIFFSGVFLLLVLAQNFVFQKEATAAGQPQNEFCNFVSASISPSQPYEGDYVTLTSVTLSNTVTGRTYTHSESTGYGPYYNVVPAGQQSTTVQAVTPHYSTHDCAESSYTGMNTQYFGFWFNITVYARPTCSIGASGPSQTGGSTTISASWAHFISGAVAYVDVTPVYNFGGTSGSGSASGFSFIGPGWHTAHLNEGNCSSSFFVPSPIDGACGSANNTPSYSAPSSGLCGSGNASGVSGNGPWNWTCNSPNGGNNASCSAPKKEDGVCGNSINSCNQGSFSDVADGACTNDWVCAGVNGGNNASCSSPKPPVTGVCGNFENSCSVGTLNDIPDNSSNYLWNCTGSCNGSTANCSLPKPVIVCYSNSDCPNNNECTVARCNNPGTTNSSCDNPPFPNGSSCSSDGNVCTTDMCFNGNCTHPATPPTNGFCGSSNNSCSVGTLNDIPDNSSNYLWNCTGSCNGSTASCSLPNPVNGVCGSSTNTCSAGTFSDTADGACTINWQCLGQNGGSNISCSNPAPPVNGVCGSNPNTCSSGTLNNIPGPTWICSGSCTGSDATCGIPSTPTVTLTVPPAVEVNTNFSISWVSTNADFVVLGSSIMPPAGCTFSPPLGLGEINGSRANVSCSTTGTKTFKITVFNSFGNEASDTKSVEVSTAPAFTLTVIKAGGGTGTATSNPAGINCGSTCSTTFSGGTSVTLTASPSAGSSFAGWSGGGCSGNGNCTVVMNQNTTVTATFNTIPIACAADSDCHESPDNVCTLDVCNNPGTPSAYCTNTVSGDHLACSGNACVSVANTAAVCTSSCSSNSDCNGGGGGPTPPGNPSASNPLCSQVQITWTDNSTNETGFKLFRDGTFLNPPGILAASVPPSATGGNMVYNYTPLDTNPHSYTVASVNGNGDSTLVPAVNNPVSSIACLPNLGSSSKTITTVNGSPYSPATLLKLGDKLIMVITVDNSQGTQAATGISIIDRLTNLKISSIGLNAVYNGTTITQGAGSGHYTITGSEPNQTLTFNLTGSSFDVPAGSIRTLAVDLDITVDASFTGSNSRMQNSAVITYDGERKTVSTPLVVFSVASGSPDILEVPPGQ